MSVSSVSSPRSRRPIAPSQAVDHEDAVWLACPRTGRRFKTERIVQSRRAWARNPRAKEDHWAVERLGDLVLATRVVFP